MAKVANTYGPQIVANGGPITKDVYQSHATELWLKGSLLYFESGLLAPVVDTKSGAAEIDTDDTGSAGVRLFLAMEDHITTGTAFVAVQEILNDTVIEIQIVASGSTDPSTGQVSQGGQYTWYQAQNTSYEGTFLIGMDVDDSTKPIFNVTALQSDYEWTRDAAGTDDYGTVRGKIISTILA